MTFARPAPSPTAPASRVWLLALLVGGLLLTLPGCSGCQKDPLAAKKEEEEKKKKKLKTKDKELPNFEVAKLVTNPDDPDEPQNFVKPGHWVTLSQQARANNFDFRAELELLAVDKDGNRFDVDRTPYQISSTRPAVMVKGQARHYEMTAYVPAATRTDQAAGANRKKVWFQSRLLSGPGGPPLLESKLEGTSEMAEYECFLLVLARESRNYLFLKTTDSSRLPTNDFEAQFISHYRVIVPKIDERVPLPENSLTWTGIAHIVWDKVNPKLLSPDQQQALLDWIHWGGNLIISSPESLDLLRGSFLEPYLAATSDELYDVEQAGLEELNAFWSIPKRNGESRRIELLPGQPLLAVRLQKHESALDVAGTGGLVVERRIGGGRIVQTAFSLDDRYLLRWRCYDGFLNGALLRRPPRDFSPLGEVANTESRPYWKLTVAGAKRSDGTPVPPLPLAVTHPLLTSTMRYFSRDIGYRDRSIEDSVRRQLDDAMLSGGLQRGAGVRPTLPPGVRPRPGVQVLPPGTAPALPATPAAPGTPAPSAPAPSAPVPTAPPATPPAPEAAPAGAPPAANAGANVADAGGDGGKSQDGQPGDVKAAEGKKADDDKASLATVFQDPRLESKDWRFGGYTSASMSGVAGWNDFSGAAHDVRLAIQEAAGIKIPSGQFVLKMIGIYLVVLVPVNWLVFRLLGKVEWAWLATPVIAVIGTVLVIQQAQLDIGFLRSRRELAILETQGDYGRGHLTRYSLLYTYLGTGYDVVLSDPNTLAQPFSKNPTFVRGTYEGPRLVQYRRDGDLRLRNFFVPSYSSEMVHSEQMFELGGGLRLEGDDPTDAELVNGSKFSLHGAAVLYCPPNSAVGEVRVAWLGDVRPGVTLPLRFESLTTQELFRIPQWDDSPVTTTAGQATPGEIRVTGLLALATKKLLLFPGDVRLVAWTDEELPGVEFAPQAAQTTTRTMVLAHLRRGLLPPASRDENVRFDYFEANRSAEEAATGEPGAAPPLDTPSLPGAVQPKSSPPGSNPPP